MHFMHHEQVQTVLDQIKCIKHSAIRYCLKCIQCLISCIILCYRQFVPSIMRKEHIHDLPITLSSWLNSECSWQCNMQLLNTWQPVLWNRNYFLRFRFRRLKSYGSGSGSGYDFWKVIVPVPVPVPILLKSCGSSSGPGPGSGSGSGSGSNSISRP